jgi:vacuolar-type H+-ATPase subunit I/STV1
MTQKRQAESKDLLGRLADAGEDALARLADVPGGRRVLDALNGMRDRIDELQKRVRRLDELEERVAALEKQLAASRPRTARRRAAASTARSRSPRTPSQKR